VVLLAAALGASAATAAMAVLDLVVVAEVPLLLEILVVVAEAKEETAYV
jgi:hypothetical protein